MEVLGIIEQRVAYCARKTRARQVIQKFPPLACNCLHSEHLFLLSPSCSPIFIIVNSSSFRHMEGVKPHLPMLKKPNTEPLLCSAALAANMLEERTVFVET
jgi:hypothetical protein